MPEKKSSPTYHVPALEKGLDVLEVLSHASEPLSLSQISEMTDKTTSELFRTLNCLLERDYVTKEDISGKYLLTLKLFELAHRHSPLDHLLQAASLPMQEMAQTLHESCHLSVIRQNQLMVLAQAESPAKVRISVSVGATFPLVHTVSGRMLLSMLPEDEIDALLTGNDDYQEMTSEEQANLLAELSKIRDVGYSTAIDESYVGLHDIAVLVGSPEAGVTAALAVTQLTASKKRGDTGRIMEALIACAETINQRVGLSQVYPLPT